MEKEKLKSISDNLERITGCPLILHNQSETMAIKRTIYSYIYNQKRLGMLYYDVFDAEMEIEDRLNNQENDEILSGLFDIIYNILNNFMRYADKKIEITLKNDNIIMYNDGPNIDENILNDIFTPYKKGINGQFGLGLSIVKKTLMLCGYEITVKNEKKGISFVINKL